MPVFSYELGQSVWCMYNNRIYEGTIWKRMLTEEKRTQRIQYRVKINFMIDDVLYDQEDLSPTKSILIERLSR